MHTKEPELSKQSLQENAFSKAIDSRSFTKSSQEANLSISLLESIKRTSLKYRFRWELITSLVLLESRFNQYAIAGRTDINSLAIAIALAIDTHVHAKGLMQVTPEVWSEWAPRVGETQPFGVNDNLNVGCAYLQWLVTQAPTEGVRGSRLEWSLRAYKWDFRKMLLRPADCPVPCQVWSQCVLHGAEVVATVGPVGYAPLLGASE